MDYALGGWVHGPVGRRQDGHERFCKECVLIDDNLYDEPHKELREEGLIE